MSEALIALADLILKKAPNRTYFNVNGLLRSALYGEGDNYSPQLYKEMTELITNSNSEIRDFLLDEEYTIVVNHSVQHDELTDKGRMAKKLGGHEAYRNWDNGNQKRKKRESNKLNFPQKYWWVVMILSWIGGCWSDIGKEAVKKKIWPESTRQPLDTLRLRDTFYIPYPDSILAK